MSARLFQFIAESADTQASCLATTLYGSSNSSRPTKPTPSPTSTLPPRANGTRAHPCQNDTPERSSSTAVIRSPTSRSSKSVRCPSRPKRKPYRFRTSIKTVPFREWMEKAFSRSTRGRRMGSRAMLYLVSPCEGPVVEREVGRDRLTGNGAAFVGAFRSFHRLLYDRYQRRHNRPPRRSNYGFIRGQAHILVAGNKRTPFPLSFSPLCSHGHLALSIRALTRSTEIGDGIGCSSWVLDLVPSTCRRVSSFGGGGAVADPLVR